MNDQDKPYIDANGTIVIPFNIGEKYHFWNGGQQHVWSNYIEKPYPGNAEGKWRISHD